jgi:uncharacterized membrane protein
MNRFPASAGQALFAASMIAIGVLGLLQNDFVAIWQPMPKAIPARSVLVYLCAFVSLTCGVGLLWRPTASIAARLWLACLLLWFALFKTQALFIAPASIVSWESSGENAVVIAAAWVLYVWFATGRDRRYLGFACSSTGLRIARTLYGLSMIAFGLAHFAYVQETAALVPAWLPAHTALVYVTGGTYVAAGVAVLVNVLARLAAALSALQMGLFTALVWLPFVAADANAFQWSETVLSLALTASAWVISDSYRGTRSE